MNFHQLHIFYTVAELGSFSAAAMSLHMTQPAVTMQVQALEQYFGTKLLRRSTKKVELSEAGRTLLPFARRSIEIVKEADQAMTRYTRMLAGRLQMAASMTFGEYIFPRIIGPFAAEYPNITVSMKVINTTQIIDELLNHQLVFGIVEAPIEHKEIDVQSVMADELKLVLPKGHPLLHLQTITIEDILPFPFVLREKGSGTRIVMEQEMLRHGLDPSRLNVVMELGSTGAVKSAVESNLGISILSVSSLKHEITLGLLETREIDRYVFTREFYSVYLKSTMLPMSAVTFLNFMRERNLDQWLI